MNTSALPHLNGEDRRMVEIQLSLVRAFARGATANQVMKAIDKVATRNPHQLVAFHTCDGSVGLAGETAVIDFDLTSYNPSDAAAIMATAITVLRPAFAEIFDNGGTVVRAANED